MTKILLLAANPKDTQQLQLGREISAIKEELRNAHYGNQFEFESEEATRKSDLSKILNRVKPDIVHFSGHGSRSSELLLEDNAGNASPVSEDALKEVFHLLRGNIRCVVLNACYAEPQAMAIAEDIDCVVGMLDQIDDDSAIAFAREFYRQLANGDDVTTAFKLGRAQIKEGKDLARICVFKANPAELKFATPPIDANHAVPIGVTLPIRRMKSSWRKFIAFLVLLIFIWGIYLGEIVLNRFLMPDAVTFAQWSIVTASSLGIIGGMVWLIIYQKFVS